MSYQTLTIPTIPHRSKSHKILYVMTEDNELYVAKGMQTIKTRLTFFKDVE
jgi:hypothetical protein